MAYKAFRLTEVFHYSLVSRLKLASKSETTNESGPRDTQLEALAVRDTWVAEYCASPAVKSRLGKLIKRKDLEEEHLIVFTEYEYESDFLNHRPSKIVHFSVAGSVDW